MKINIIKMFCYSHILLYYNILLNVILYIYFYDINIHIYIYIFLYIFKLHYIHINIVKH